jgi:hypothetical protein
VENVPVLQTILSIQKIGGKLRHVIRARLTSIRSRTPNFNTRFTFEFGVGLDAAPEHETSFAPKPKTTDSVWLAGSRFSGFMSRIGSALDWLLVIYSSRRPEYM